MTGSARDRTSASGVRLDRRTQRAAMTRAWPPCPGRLRGRAMSDMGTLHCFDGVRPVGGVLLVGGVRLVGAAVLGGARSPGEEDVVEGGAVQVEAGHEAAVWVDDIEQVPHVRGTAIGGDAVHEARRVTVR